VEIHFGRGKKPRKVVDCGLVTNRFTIFKDELRSIFEWRRQRKDGGLAAVKGKVKRDRSSSRGYSKEEKKKKKKKERRKERGRKKRTRRGGRASWRLYQTLNIGEGERNGEYGERRGVAPLGEALDVG